MKMFVSGLMLAFIVSLAQADESFFLMTSSVPNSASGGRVRHVTPYTYEDLVIDFGIKLYQPMAVDFDPKENMIYWSEIGTYRRIRRASLDGRKVETVMSTPFDTEIDGLAVDPDERLIFYSDAANNVIRKMTIGTFSPYTIVPDLDKPHAIVLHIKLGMIFWADWGATPKIERGNYYGLERQVLITADLTIVNALALDAYNGILYWVDAGTDKIERCDLDGNDRREVLTAVAQFHFFGLTLFEKSLYITDWTNDGSSTTTSQLLRVWPDEQRGEIVATMTNGRMNNIQAAISIVSGSQAVCVTRAGWTGTALLATLVIIIIG